MQLINNLNWRYATKRYKSNKLSNDKLDTILEAMRLSASSGGLQPYRLFVIDNPKIRRELGKDSFNYQITEASHLICIASYTQLDQKHIDDYIKRMADIRNINPEELTELKGAMENYYLKLTNDEIFHWASKQAYIALGTGLIAAAELRVDSSPMEGFNAKELDQILGLDKMNLKSVVLLAVGYRDESKDDLSNAKKVRLPQKDFVQVIS